MQPQPLQGLYAVHNGINMNMNSREKDTDQTIKKPDDRGIVQVDCFVKVYDPETKEIFVEKRA